MQAEEAKEAKGKKGKGSKPVRWYQRLSMTIMRAMTLVLTKSCTCNSMLGVPHACILQCAELAKLVYMLVYMQAPCTSRKPHQHALSQIMGLKGCQNANEHEGTICRG